MQALVALHSNKTFDLNRASVFMLADNYITLFNTPILVIVSTELIKNTTSSTITRT